MNVEIELCQVYGCFHNQNGLCTLQFVTLNHSGSCDQKATQEPLPEPSK